LPPENAIILLYSISMFTKKNDIYSIDTGADPVIAFAGKSANPVDYRLNHLRIRQNEKKFLCSVTSLEKKNIIFINQVHGDRIKVFDAIPEKDLPTAGEADAMITNQPGLCLVIRTADCVPVFLFDNSKQILGAIHSGWKGTLLEITRKTLRMMVFVFGTDPADIKAYILPSIGPESYQVNRDVFDLFNRGRHESAGNLYLDLWENIGLSLVDEGVRAKNIFNSGICTHRHNNEFYSHRCGDQGRNLNFGFMNSYCKLF